MRGDPRKLLAFGVDKLAADGTFEVKMLVTALRRLDHYALIAGSR